MRGPRQLTGMLLDAREEERDGCPGLALRFGPAPGAAARAWDRLELEGVDDWTPLGDAGKGGGAPTGTGVPVVLGLARLLRLLRAGRVAAPADPGELLGRPALAAALARRAVGATVLLSLRPRSTVRFTVWTDRGVESVRDVLDVSEGDDAFWVRRRAGAASVRVARRDVIRTATDRESWYEVVGIERPRGPG